MMSWKKSFASVAALSAVFVLAAGLVWLRPVWAATGKIYFSSSSESVAKGSTVTLTIRITPDTSVNTVHIVVGYSTSKLKYSSISYSGSSFSTQPTAPSASGGKLTFDQVDLGGSVSASSSFVAKVKFKALVGSGSDSVSLSGSDAANNGTSTHPANSGTTVKFTTPSSSSSGGSSSGGGSSSSSSSSSSKSSSSSSKKSSSSSKPATPTAPTIAVENPQYSEVSLTVNTPTNSQVYIEYGTTEKLGSKTAPDKSGKVHVISFGSAKLLPATTYYYEVFAKSSDGKVTHSGMRMLTTKGLTIKITVYDKNHHLLKDAAVTLHSSAQTVKTDDQGVATFTNVTPGQHTLSYTVGGQTYSQPLTVTSNVQTTGGQQSASTENLSVAYGFAQPQPWWQAPWFLIGLAAVIVIVIVLFVVKRRRPAMLGAPITAAGTADGVMVSGMQQPMPGQMGVGAMPPQVPGQGIEPAEYYGQPQPTVQTQPMPTQPVQPGAVYPGQVPGQPVPPGAPVQNGQNIPVNSPDDRGPSA